MSDAGNAFEQRYANIGKDWLPLLVAKICGEADTEWVHAFCSRRITQSRKIGNSGGFHVPLLSGWMLSIAISVPSLGLKKKPR